MSAYPDLFDQMKRDLTRFRKGAANVQYDEGRRHRQKQAVIALQVAVGEIQNKLTAPYKEADIFKILNGFKKNWTETLNLRPSDDLEFQIEVIDMYLPVQLSAVELTAIARGFEKFPEFMKFLKETHPNKYDGKLAKEQWDKLQ